jgi:hypothetical protein
MINQFYRSNILHLLIEGGLIKFQNYKFRHSTEFCIIIYNFKWNESQNYQQNCQQHEGIEPIPIHPSVSHSLS